MFAVGVGNDELRRLQGQVAVDAGGDGFCVELGELDARFRLMAFHTMYRSNCGTRVNYVASEMGQSETEATVMKPMRW